MPSAMPKILSYLVSGSFGIICARRAKISFSLFVIVFTSFLFLRFLSILVVHVAFYVMSSYTVITGTAMPEYYDTKGEFTWIFLLLLLLLFL